MRSLDLFGSGIGLELDSEYPFVLVELWTLLAKAPLTGLLEMCV